MFPQLGSPLIAITPVIGILHSDRHRTPVSCSAVHSCAAWLQSCGSPGQLWGSILGASNTLVYQSCPCEYLQCGHWIHLHLFRNPFCFFPYRPFGWIRFIWSPCPSYHHWYNCGSNHSPSQYEFCLDQGGVKVPVARVLQGSTSIIVEMIGSCKIVVYH
jgi:hypothetical protein